VPIYVRHYPAALPDPTHAALGSKWLVYYEFTTYMLVAAKERAAGSTAPSNSSAAELAAQFPWVETHQYPSILGRWRQGPSFWPIAYSQDEPQTHDTCQEIGHGWPHPHWHNILFTVRHC